MKARIKILIVFALCISLLSAYIPAFAATEFEEKINALSRDIDALAVYDVTEQKMLFGKNENRHIYIASTTKLMTCLVALSVFHPDDVITVGDEIYLKKPNSSVSLIQPGHKLKMRTLLAALLLPSGNDAAYTVAVNTARKHSGNAQMEKNKAVTYFCNLMVEEARRLGCNNTYFVNPEGWDNSNHYSTASDMAKIAVAAANNAIIASIANIHSGRFYFYSGENIVWDNTNKLLDPESSYYYPYAHGLKTGTTPLAGKCLIAFAEKDGRKIIICAYGCKTEDDRFARVRDIFEYVFSSPAEEETTAPPTETTEPSEVTTAPSQETTTTPETTIPGTEVSTTLTAPVIGDVDGSGDINASDARLVLRAAVGLEELTPHLKDYGDADRDGELTASDARLILRAAVGLEKI